MCTSLTHGTPPSSTNPRPERMRTVQQQSSTHPHLGAGPVNVSRGAQGVPLTSLADSFNLRTVSLYNTRIALTAQDSRRFPAPRVPLRRDSHCELFPPARLQAQRLREASTGTAPWSVSSPPASRTFRAHPLSRSLQSVTASPALEVLPMDSRGSCTAPDCACATFVGSAHARQVVHVRDARALALVLTRRLQRPARNNEPCSTCRHPWFSHASLPPTTRVITSHGPVPTGYCRRTHCGGFFHVRQPLVRVPRNHGSHLLSLCHRLRHSRAVRALHWLPNTLTWLDPLWSECSIERRHGRVPDHAQQSLDRVDWS